MPEPTSRSHPRRWRIARHSALVLIGLGLAIQAVPYGRSHTNPPVEGSPRWDSPRTEALARRACFSCHSHETQWPWYASVAPLSWRIEGHVDEGRAKLDFSLPTGRQGEVDEAASAVAEGEMPPWDYVLAHPEARLTPQEKADLVAGLRATFGSERGAGTHGEEHETDDDR